MRLRRLAGCHPEKRHWAKGLCHRCYIHWQRPGPNIEQWVESYATNVELREAALEEWHRIDAWARWPDPSLRFLAPIGEMPYDRHGHDAEIKTKSDSPDMTELNPPEWTRTAAIAKRGHRRPKAGELLDPAWAG